MVKLTTSYNVDQKHHLEPTYTYAHSPAPCSLPGQLHLISSTHPHLYEDSRTSVSELGGRVTPSSLASIPSLEATELRSTKSGTGFKDSTHWTSALSGVTEAKGQGVSLGAIQPEPAFDHCSSPLDQNVPLFEGCKHATDQELLSSITPRREPDSLVSLYFRAQEYRCRCARDAGFRVHSRPLADRPKQLQYTRSSF